MKRVENILNEKEKKVIFILHKLIKKFYFLKAIIINTFIFDFYFLISKSVLFDRSMFVYSNFEHELNLFFLKLFLL